MPESRRDRVVMVLGLAALLLFAANFVAFIQQQFFGHDQVQHAGVVHVEADLLAHDAVIVPHIRHRVIDIERLHGIQEEAMARATARLTEEVARLSEESARLAEDGHTDAAANLDDAVEQLRLKLDQLREETKAVQQEVEFKIQSESTDGTSADVHTIVLTAPAAPAAPVHMSVTKADEAPVAVTVVQSGSNR